MEAVLGVGGCELEAREQTTGGTAFLFACSNGSAECIQALAAAGCDTAARFGGEEFVVAMPDTPLDVAFTVADRIRVKVAEEPVTLPDGSPISVTLSAGVAESDPKGDTTADLIERADKALYIAKHEGRDMVIKAPPPPGAEADGNGAA